MPKLSIDQLPKYRLHKASNRAVVTIDGRDVYLGPYKSEESKKAYKRVTTDWKENCSLAHGGDVTVAELCVAFMRHAERYYRDPDGKPTAEFQNFKDAVRVWMESQSDTLLREFGPNALRTVRGLMIERGWCRNTVNSRINRIRHVVKWGVGRQMVRGIFLEELRAVETLPKGKSAARDTEEVTVVADDVVEETLPHVSRQVAAMIRLQLLTGMRPGEVCIMRGVELHTGGAVWEFRPARHKTAHRGHKRIIYLGKQAREIVTEFLQPNPNAYLFSPAAAEAERREKMRAGRKTPIGRDNRTGTRRAQRRSRAPGERYTVAAYRKAISRACEDAFPPPDHLAHVRVPGNGRKRKATRWETVAEWRARLGDAGWAELEAWRDAHNWHPHQLRHSAATRFGATYSVETVAAILGHKSIKTTEIYMKVDSTRAQSVMAAVG